MKQSTPKLVERQYLLPFILITALFALWGFANDITNPMVAAFQTIIAARVMSGPVPSPSMKGMIGFSGTQSFPPFKVIFSLIGIL